MYKGRTMRKKDLIYFASAALLLSVSAQVAKADEVTSNEPVTADNNHQQVAPSVETKTGEELVPATSYTAPATVVESTERASQPVASAVTSSVSSEETASATESTTTAPQEKPSVGASTFFDAGSHAPASRSTDVAVQPKTFVDVSSHNGDISVEDYRVLANKGVGGVVVKLTENTWYNNPNAASQIRNAQAVGLQVSTYHFSRYTTEEAARAEARFYIAAAQRLGLPKSTLMVNDFEDAKMQPNINRNTQAWADEMRKNGYTNLMFYTSASWLDENNLHKKGPVNTAQFGIENFWVAQYPAPKLSANDAKTLRYNGKAGAWQFSSQAELLPGKHLFDHNIDYTGRFTANYKQTSDPTQGNLSGKISVINNDTMTGRFDVLISDVKAPNGVASVSVPIWSDVNGQDDLLWYVAAKQNDGTYKVSVKASDHKNSTGKYNIHLYYNQLNGKQIGVTTSSTEVSIGKRPNVPVSADLSIDVDKSAGTFTITAKNLKGFENYKEIKIPFWSHAKGMDDIKWYTPVRQSDGSYKVVAKAIDHENVDGRYEAQIFYYDAQGQRQFVQKAFAEYSTGKPNVPVSADLSIDVDKSAGTFTITAKNLKGFENYKEIKIPFWSHAKGMDDIKWYTPVRQLDGSYKVVAKASDHENVDGRYEAQIFYYDAQGQRQFVQKAFAEYKKEQPLSGTLSIENNNKDTGTFDVIIKDVYSPKGVRTVQVPIWSAKDGQDDIRWYEAARQANGDYKVSVKASDHKNSTGLYYVHLYYIQNDGSRVGVLASSTEVEFRNANTKTRAFIKNVNVEAGTYMVEVDQAPQGRHIKNVRVAAWSQDHQENLYWYSTAPTGMQTDVQVSAVNHKNLAGNYTTHVYVDYVDGGVEGFNLGQTALNPRGTTGQTGLSPRVDSGQRDRVLRAAASLVGVRGGSAAHQQLVNDYNSVRPLPVGYAVKNTDDWCDVFVTTIFQREGLSDLVGRECGVERHIQIFKRLGIWNEDGGSTPKAGDIITFNWDQDSQPNNGFADHIGIVESVSNGVIHTIEGNSNDQVRRKTYRIGHGNIRGSIVKKKHLHLFRLKKKSILDTIFFNLFLLL